MNHIVLILDIIICSCSFAGLYFFKTASFIPQDEYFILFILYLLFSLFFSFYYQKYKCAFAATFRAYYRSLFISSSFTLFFLVLIVAITDLKIVSRYFLFNIVAIPSILELLFVYFLRWWLPGNLKIENNGDEISDITETMTLKLKWLVTGLGLLITAFFIMIKYKTGVFVYYPWSEKILLIILISSSFIVFCLINRNTIITFKDIRDVNNIVNILLIQMDYEYLGKEEGKMKFYYDGLEEDWTKLNSFIKNNYLLKKLNILSLNTDGNTITINAQN